jgi:hypothetical protein
MASKTTTKYNANYFAFGSFNVFTFQWTFSRLIFLSLNLSGPFCSPYHFTPFFIFSLFYFFCFRKKTFFTATISRGLFGVLSLPFRGPSKALHLIAASLSWDGMG